MKADISTQPRRKTSGTIPVPNIGDQPSQSRGGRQTRNSQKAAQPPTPGSSPPTHPCEATSDIGEFVKNQRSSPFPVLPSISQLRDFPNLSAELLSKKITVELPSSAPVSPISTQNNLFIEEGNPITPSGSPAHVSVILSNPNLLPDTQLQPRASTPTFLVSQLAEGAGSWDNYLDDPTYKKFGSEFWSSRAEANKVRIVSTDVSNLSDLSESSVSANSVLNQAQMSTPDTEMEAAAESLRDLETKVSDMVSDCEPGMITVDSAPSMKEELNKIGDIRDKYRSCVRKFLSTYSEKLSSSEKLQWEQDMQKTVSVVNKHKFDVLAKVNKLLPASSRMSAFEQASLDLQKKQLELQEQEVTSKKEEAVAIAQPIKNLIIEKCTDLDSELEVVSVGELVTGDDILVSRTMQKLSAWKSSLQSIVQLYQEFQTKTAVHSLPESDHTLVNSSVEKTKSLLADIVSVAEDQDQKRQLFSLDNSNRGEQIKWPVFSGDYSEDFFKFKKDFLEAAAQNKTSARNQVAKLKENLRGYAKSLIPHSISSITRALEILEHACGDTMRVVMHRVDKLLNVGSWPSEGSKDCYSKQVKWVVQVQTLLEEIIELANSKEELADVIYNREKLAQILKLFPTFMVDKFVKIPGYKEEKFRAIINKLDEFKLTSQNREMIYGSSASVSQSKDKTSSNAAIVPSCVPAGYTTFSKPQNFPDCRVCKVLETQGGHNSCLFEKHISDYVTGCPKFASLGNAQRLVVAKEAKFCLKCMGKDVKFSTQHNRQCPVISKKSSFSCKAEKCFFHMWVCSKHDEENKSAMERFSSQLRTKSGIKLVFISVIEN